MMFSGILGSIGTKLAVLGLLAAIMGVLYWRYNIVRDERDKALAMVGSLRTVNEVQRGTIDEQGKAIREWSESQKRLQQTVRKMMAVQTEAGKTARRLDSVLEKHDLRALSLAKPGLVERRINRGTASVFRMLDVETR